MGNNKFTPTQYQMPVTITKKVSFTKTHFITKNGSVGSPLSHFKILKVFPNILYSQYTNYLRLLKYYLIKQEKNNYSSPAEDIIIKFLYKNI